MRAFLIGVGGGIGSLARYWLAGAVQGLNGAMFPAGTLAVNIAGSFLIGLIMALSLERGLLSSDLRVFLTVGFCGGFTTMSTFSYETLALLRDGSFVTALSNVTLSFFSCMVAVWLGDALARVL